MHEEEAERQLVQHNQDEKLTKLSSANILMQPISADLLVLLTLLLSDASSILAEA